MNPFVIGNFLLIWLDVGVVVVTTCRREDFDHYLEGPFRIIGICLDHDMPFYSGRVFAKILREKNIPIAITSLNIMGAGRISDILDEYETPNIELPCTSDHWELEAAIFLGSCKHLTSHREIK